MIQTLRIDLPHATPSGIQLHCRISGPPDGRLLLFLHGFPEAAFVWDDCLRWFADPANGGYRCVAPNLRGYDDSSAPTDIAAYRARHLTQDIVLLIQALQGDASQPLAALVAHDWGGAVAWSVAAGFGHLMQRLVIVNSPHPATFLRELQSNPRQQAASAYMNFLARPDAADLLAENDFARLWPFFENMGATDGPHAWLTTEVREHYRKTWRKGLHGPCAYYAASPLRPATADDPGAQAVELPDALCHVTVQTQVIWAQEDHALLPELTRGLTHWVPDLRMVPVPNATHWVLHEQPQRVIGLIQDFLNS